MFKCCFSLYLLKILYTYTMYPWSYPPQLPSLSSPCSAHLHVTLCSVSLACMSMGNQSVATPLMKNDAFPSATTSCQWLPSWRWSLGSSSLISCWIAWFHANLLQATDAAVEFWVLLCNVQKTVRNTLPTILFLQSSPTVPEPCRDGAGLCLCPT